MRSAVRLDGVSVTYGSTPALVDLTLDVAEGEVLALLGSSGSGKTTLLHTVAGFIEPSGGVVTMDGTVVAGPARWVPPEDRRVGLVFQGAALWPHLTVLDTVAYPIRRRGLTKPDARAEAASLLARVGLAELGDRLPAQLSGGEQQRVGLARALARDPAVFLFDEPTAHLDTPLRGVVLDEISRRREALGASALYATHNAAEALAIAGRVAVLRAGRLVQLDTPRGVYEQPVDVDTARLTGPASFLEIAALPRGIVSDQEAHTGGQVLVRPDWVRLEGPLPGRVESVGYRGPHTDVWVSTAAGPVLVTSPGPPSRTPGERVGLTITQCWPMPACAPATTARRPSQEAVTDA